MNVVHAMEAFKAGKILDILRGKVSQSPLLNKKNESCLERDDLYVFIVIILWMLVQEASEEFVAMFAPNLGLVLCSISCLHHNILSNASGIIHLQDS
jgi:hypothetical protein